MTVTRKARDRSLRVPEMCYFRGDAVMDIAAGRRRHHLRRQQSIWFPRMNRGYAR